MQRNSRTTKWLSLPATMALMAVMATPFSVGCDASDRYAGMSDVPLGRVEDLNGGNSFLTVTSIKGPEGASLTNPTVGEYAVIGYYDFSGADYEVAAITANAQGGGAWKPGWIDLTPGRQSGLYEVRFIVMTDGPGSLDLTVELLSPVDPGDESTRYWLLDRVAVY